MNRSTLFWLVFILWAIFYVVTCWPVSRRDASNVLLGILLALLGWTVYGDIVK
jgi:hypothetical protein